MTDTISSFVEEFPLVPVDAYDPEVFVDPYLVRLLRIIGYDDSVIHRNVKIDVGDDVYEPTDLGPANSITYSVYVAEDPDSSPHLVGWGDDSIYPLSEGERGGHATYEALREAHETAKPNLTLLLTPYDLLVYDGSGSLFHGAAHAPIEYYSLHESDFDQETEQKLIDELEPPSDLI